MSFHIWMTKWVTGWLPLGKNMKCWGFWTTDLCPECQQPESNPSHLLQCSAPEHRQWLKNKILTLERTLLERKLSLQAVSFLLGVLFPQEFPRPTSSPEELIKIRHWQGLFNTLPTAWGFLHNSWTSVLQQCPPVATNFKHSPRQWLAVFLSQLWNIAWDLWGTVMVLFTLRTILILVISFASKLPPSILWAFTPCPLLKVIGLRALWKLFLHDHWNTSTHGFLLFRPFVIVTWTKKREKSCLHIAPYQCFCTSLHFQ